VPCYAPGCQKALPQKLVLAFSGAANALAALVDDGGLCAEAWLGQVCPLCAEVGYCGAVRPTAPDEPDPICPICCERRPALLHDPDHPTCCEHAACQDCWVKWAEEHFDRCTAERAMAVPCIWPQCGPPAIGERLARHLALVSHRLQELQDHLAQRRRLQENELFPASMQVDCPRVGCVGLGYLGFDMVMCFICEYQWVPEEGAGEAPQTDAEHVMGLEVKRCPGCKEYIEKNGGCNHMTCRCKHEFWWTTLEPYRLGA